MNEIPPISTSSFYQKSPRNDRKRSYGDSNNAPSEIQPYKTSRLLEGPPITWRVFRKQAEALLFASMYKHHLMTFVFETGTTRLFLVAHPELFWHYDVQKPPNARSSYEVIPENTVCKLYFDLEFNKDVNPNKDGYKMVSHFILLVIHYLKEKLEISCSENDVLNLDSTTDTKFSCHLIFNISGVCFGNNKQAGNFVNYICNEISQIKETKDLPGDLKGVSVEDCCGLFVLDQKGNTTIFCDRSVYSRNRHFRLYMSSKYGKGAPLIISSINKYEPNNKDSNYERNIFYASLITYLPYNHENLRVINFDYTYKYKQSSVNLPAAEYLPRNPMETTPSPFTKIDEFINRVVSPGKIHRSCYFSVSNVINYDIIGNRYCGNIGRPHKNNNVKYIIDLKNGVYYQKCHDFDCKDYKSERKALPPELQLISDTGECSKIGSFEISDSPKKKIILERFPSCGLGDEEIINHLSDNKELDV